MNPPKTITDPNDKKPTNWDEREKYVHTTFEMKNNRLMPGIQKHGTKNTYILVFFFNACLFPILTDCVRISCV